MSETMDLESGSGVRGAGHGALPGQSEGFSAVPKSAGPVARSEECPAAAGDGRARPSPRSGCSVSGGGGSEAHRGTSTVSVFRSNSGTKKWQLSIQQLARTR